MPGPSRNWFWAACRPPLWALLAAAFVQALGAQALIDGRLLERRGDKLTPVSHCTVFATSIDRGPLVGEFPDEQGRFLLDLPPDARVNVGIICPEYFISTINGRATPPLTHDCSQPGPCASIEMVLEPLAVVEGRVVSPWGEPVEGIGVELRMPGNPRGRRLMVSSDDRGNFRIGGVRPGRYDLAPIVPRQIDGGLRWEGRPQRVELSAGDVVSGLQVGLELVEPSRLSARLQGLPPGVRRIEIQLRAQEGRIFVSRSVDVDEEGRIELEGLSPGGYQVRINNVDGGEDAAVLVGSVEVRAGGSEVILRTQRPGRLAGVLRPERPERDDLARMYMGGVSLALRAADGRIEYVSSWAPDYRLDDLDLPPGEYEVRLASASGEVLRKTAEDEWERLENLAISEGETVELELKAAYHVGRLAVFVRPPDGSEAGHYVVALREADSETMIYPTDQHGKLVIRDMSSGDYTHRRLVRAHLRTSRGPRGLAPGGRGDPELPSRGGR
jgi:hypothetical protein